MDACERKERFVLIAWQGQRLAVLPVRLAGRLCPERPSLVTHGRIQSWACGVAYAIGRVNFLSDPSQTRTPQ